MNRTTRFAPLVLAALTLAACGDTLINSRALYVEPPYTRSELKDCESIAKAIKSMDAQIKTVEGYVAKSETESGGVVVATMVHKPELASLRAERYSLREAAQQNGCPPATP